MNFFNKKFILLFLIILAFLVVFGKSKKENNTSLLESMADEKSKQGYDPCMRLTAQSILRSGFDFPKKRIIKNQETNNDELYFDVWVGEHRFEIPAYLISPGSGYEYNHPQRFWKLAGNLPDFYPKGNPGPAINGMSSMVTVYIKCNLDEEFIKSWGQGHKSTKQSIVNIQKRYENELKRKKSEAKNKSSIKINTRNDIGMIELLFEHGQYFSDGRPRREATYWPIDRELRGPSGDVSAIICLDVRHEPDIGYGDYGRRCVMTMRIRKEVYVIINLNVTQIIHAEKIFWQVSKLFETK